MTARRVRVWRCPCCGDAYHRRRGEETPHRLWDRVCQRCDRAFVAGRTTGRRDCRHRRAESRYLAWRERYASAPRTRAGRRLGASREVRAAWARVRKAKTRPAIERHARTWLTLLLEETRRRPTPNAWTRVVHEDGSVHRSWGGRIGAPTITFQRTAGRRLHGDFRAAFLDGVYEIRVWDRDQSLDKVRETLVHEVLHALDADARMPDTGHDRLWDARLAIIQKLFPPTQWGTR